MNFVSTAVAGAFRGVCRTSHIQSHLNCSSILRRTLVSESRATQEEEDVLYKRCEVQCRSVDPAVLKSYSRFAQMAANELGITVGECITPRKANKKRWSVLKSVFIYAKHQVQYEVRTYYHTMNFHHLTGSTADTFLEYIERNLPEGVAMKVTRVRLERLPEHLKTPPDHSLREEAEEEETNPQKE